MAQRHPQPADLGTTKASLSVGNSLPRRGLRGASSR